MYRRTLQWGSLLFLMTLLAVSCDPADPVAPTGTVLHLSVYPTRISSNGTAQVTVSAIRANGNPVNPGTEIRLSTTLGTIDPVIRTDASGVARGTLRGDGRVGTATVSAFSGAVEPVTAEVVIGQLAASLSLQVSPSGVPESGGTLDLLALVRDDQSQPLADAAVNFRSQVGTLESGGRFVMTNAAGEARDRLRVTAADLQAVGDNNFEVAAEVGGSGGSTITRTFQVAIQRKPRASFTFQVVGLTATFTDTSTGSPTAWLWDFGDQTPVSTQRNPVHVFPGPGRFVVTLTVSNAIGSDSASAIVQISQ